MAIHEFSFNDGAEQQTFVPPPNHGLSPNQVDPPLAQQFIHTPNVIVAPGSEDERDEFHYNGLVVEDNIDTNFHEEVREVLVPGFKLMDRGIKNYFSGIRIPVNKGTEQYRMLHVKIAGSDESTFFADKSIVGGRLQPPYLAITRTAENPDPSRFSPAYLPLRRRYLNNGRRMELVYRPVPYLIDYTLDIWGEHKSDVEHALYVISSRFNPIASYYLDEQHVTYEVVLKSISHSDQSDLEPEATAHAEVKKSINIQMEAWLPLPTKVVPTILAKPLSIKEGILTEGEVKLQGETYMVIRDNPFPQRKPL